jgi:hypothetical protein
MARGVLGIGDKDAPLCSLGDCNRLY